MSAAFLLKDLWSFHPETEQRAVLEHACLPDALEKCRACTALPGAPLAPSRVARCEVSGADGVARMRFGNDMIRMAVYRKEELGPCAMVTHSDVEAGGVASQEVAKARAQSIHDGALACSARLRTL